VTVVEKGDLGTKSSEKEKLGVASDTSFSA